MGDEVLLRQAVDVAWSVYLATHTDVDAADRRRCLLARHLQRKCANSRSDAEELVCFGLAYLDRTVKDDW